MAEEKSDQEKTEQASPKRREEARKKGQVVKSQEFVSVAVLMTAMVFFYFSASGMTGKIINLMRWMFNNSSAELISCDNINHILITFVYKYFVIMMPLFLLIVLMALVVNYLQVGFVFSTESIQPKLSKINPINGFQRLFSLRSLVELLKNIFKIIIVGVIVYITIKGEIKNLIPLVDQNIWGILTYIGSVIFKITFRTCLVLIMLAILDYSYQRWEFEKNLKMSKQEVKEEHKQTEGDPFVRARIRRIQREMARKRMMANVPNADVIITNPTHIAIALQYNDIKMSAPKVVAKGKGILAERIKEIAKENEVPVVENKPLAQVLYKVVNVDEMIPSHLYRAVAEVLAYIYRTKRK